MDEKGLEPLLGGWELVGVSVSGVTQVYTTQVVIQERKGDRTSIQERMLPIQSHQKSLWLTFHFVLYSSLISDGCGFDGGYPVRGDDGLWRNHTLPSETHRELISLLTKCILFDTPRESCTLLPRNYKVLHRYRSSFSCYRYPVTSSEKLST